MSRRHLTIGMLSAQTNCNIPTIRYYEQIGLLPAAQRASNGHRYYRESDFTRLAFIRRCRDFGFSIEEVRGMVGLFEEETRPCAEVQALAQSHLIAVRIKLEEIKQLEACLTRCVASCDEECIGGPARDCTIIEELASSAQSLLGTALPDSGCSGSPLAASGEVNFKEVKRK